MNPSEAVLHGDCREVMKSLEDCSFHACVTDPPYELSDDGKASAERVLLELMLPEQSKIQVETPDRCELRFLVAQVLELGRVRLEPAPPAAVPVAPVALDHDVSRRNHDVEDVRVGAVAGANGDGGFQIEPEAAQHLGCFAFEATDAAALLNALNGAGAGFLSGGIGVGFRVETSRLPGLLRELFAVNGGDVDVGALNDALAIGVGADLRTEEFAVARVGLARGSDDCLTAPAALVLLCVLKLGAAKLVRASARTGGLSAVFEARRVRVVHHVTGRALTFDLIVHPVNLATKGFMGKGWDGSKIAFDVSAWREVYRILKPGSYLLAFGATRTFHRLVCAIEDAGFEIRDTLCWLYSSGMPKSLNVSKAIDKAAGAERPVVGTRVLTGNAAQSTKEKGGTYASNTSSKGCSRIVDVTAAATPEAEQWDGFGTNLKPALELICVARKPLEGSVAENVLKHGAGALNIDACRIDTGGEERRIGSNPAMRGGAFGAGTYEHGTTTTRSTTEGRWPANVCLDETAAELLDAQSGVLVSGKMLAGTERAGIGYQGGKGCPVAADTPGDSGGASRFFYVSKASREEREAGLKSQGETRANQHPCVKPLALIRWLLRLAVPPKGRVLDPFCGSGTTLYAAVAEGFDGLGIEREQAYVELSRARLQHALDTELPLLRRAEKSEPVEPADPRQLGLAV